MLLSAITFIAGLALLFAGLALPLRLAAQEQQQNRHQPRYRLVDLGTFGGPQSFGDAGHGAGNITSQGIAVGVADTTTPDPFYPNFNPLGFFPDPFVHHAFRTKNRALIDLGALPGTNSSSLGGRSENGLVSGQSLNGTIDPLTGWPEQNAVLWQDGQIINLGTLGGYESGAGRPNSHGQIAGFSGNAIPDAFSILGLGTQTRAFLWQDGQMHDLGTLGGPDAFAFAVNERGQVIGFSYVNTAPSSNCPWPLTTDPFLWEDGKMVDLGTLGGTCGEPAAINDRGQVVGTSNVAGDAESHAFLWDQGRLTDIGTLGGTFGGATSLNEAGEVVGQATTAGDQALHAFFWHRGVMTDLGPLPGFGDATCIGAFDINSRRQIVGQAVENFCAGPGAHAFLWQDGNMIDLNVFVPPGSDLTLADVENINDRGEMFGSAVLPNGDTHAFLLIPVGEDDPEGITASPENLVALANHTGQILRTVTDQPAPRNFAAELRARAARRYHIPSLTTPNCWGARTLSGGSWGETYRPLPHQLTIRLLHPPHAVKLLSCGGDGNKPGNDRLLHTWQLWAAHYG